MFVPCCCCGCCRVHLVREELQDPLAPSVCLDAPAPRDPQAPLERREDQ